MSDDVKKKMLEAYVDLLSAWRKEATYRSMPASGPDRYVDTDLFDHMSEDFSKRFPPRRPRLLFCELHEMRDVEWGWLGRTLYEGFERVDLYGRKVVSVYMHPDLLKRVASEFDLGLTPGDPELGAVLWGVPVYSDPRLEPRHMEIVSQGSGEAKVHISISMAEE